MMMRPTANIQIRTSAAVALLSLFTLAGCRHHAPANAGLQATAQGTALVESSGGHQVGATGTALKDPLVVQVNDDQGNAVPGALIEFHGPAGVSFDPSAVLADSSGQATTSVTLGDTAGRYQISAVTPGKAKLVSLGVVETALDYQERVGAILADKYCSRCHDPESSPERVSNYDVEQDERRRSDLDHSAWRPGLESFGSDAAVREYAECLVRKSSHCLHARGVRSSVSAARDGLRPQVDLSL